MGASSGDASGSSQKRGERGRPEEAPRHLQCPPGGHGHGHVSPDDGSAEACRRDPHAAESEPVAEMRPVQSQPTTLSGKTDRKCDEHEFVYSLYCGIHLALNCICSMQLIQIVSFFFFNVKRKVDF